jgi:hypothetical protein
MRSDVTKAAKREAKWPERIQRHSRLSLEQARGIEISAGERGATREMVSA